MTGVWHAPQGTDSFEEIDQTRPVNDARNVMSDEP
jgi:hypothetical protein